MSVSDESGPEPAGGEDITAAEYVLGVQPAEERQGASRRIDLDPAFARLVDRWEAYFSPLAVGYAEVQAPGAVKVAVDRRLFADGSRQAAAGGGLLSSLVFWRGLTAAAIAALLLYVALPFINPPAQLPQTRLVASLAADGSDVRYLAIYDAARGDVALSRLSGERAAQQDFELWLIEGDNPPASMGVIPPGDAIHLAVPAATRDKLASGAVLAVSREPVGGSPTGQPTGPVVAVGDLKTI